ncbi:MAG: type IV-A pilus assembly ATPase PilB [Rhodanobacter sp.]
MSPAAAGLPGLARRLVAEGVLAEAEVRKAVVDSTTEKSTLMEWLLDHGMVESADLTQIASVEFGIPMMDVNALNPAHMPLSTLSEALVTKHQALPLFVRGKRLFVGIFDPTRSHALDEIRFNSNCAVETVLVERNILQRAIDSALTTMRNDTPVLGAADLSALELDTTDAEPDATGIDASSDDDAPIVKFVNNILLEAIRRGASDIHFEPFEAQFRVRMRIDGILRAMVRPPSRMANRISSRLKVMAQLDIAEKRVPQDGRIKLNLSKTHSIDFRVSSLPTLFGEKIVLRILDGSAARIGIEKLGYEPDQQKLYIDAIHQPYGMVLVTGPTGSGKTVSLYTALNLLNTDERNISTVEDPVEIRVDGINQVQQNEKRGMTFARALRSFLRQDPDVIMVGEIRDTETAEIAIKAAQTGHMVLSTLHTNDAPQTVARLMKMGIASYNITSSVSLIVAQRLARRLHECKKPQHLPVEALLKLGFTQADLDEGFTLYEAVGCSACNDGYKGRVGIYQVMPMLEEIQRVILKGGDALEIGEVAKAAGVRDLHDSALRKVKQGLTSLTEINRVITE